MSGEIDAVDQYGNRYKARRVGGGDGCLGSPLLLAAIGVIVLIGGILWGIGQLVSSGQNYATYHVLTPDQTQAIKGATVTALASSQSPYGGKLVLDDPLQDNSKGYKWEESDDKKGDVCGFKNGAYHVSVATVTKGANYCAAGATNFGNFVYQITMSFSTATAGSLIFRLHREVNSNDVITKQTCYELNITVYGYYVLVAWTGNKVITLYDATSAGATNEPLGVGLLNPTQPNVIAIVAKGSTFDLYINYKHIATMHDHRFSSGQIGVAAYPNPSSPESSEVVFSDAKVWKL